MSTYSGQLTATLQRSDTAQAGAATTITLDASASAVDDAYNGFLIQITAGVGIGQRRRITDYVGSTKVATVDVVWVTNPDSSSVFKVSEPVRFPSVIGTAFTIKGLSANTGLVYVGNDGSDENDDAGIVDSFEGFELNAKEDVVFEVNNLEAVFLDAAITGEGVSWARSA